MPLFWVCVAAMIVGLTIVLTAPQIADFNAKIVPHLPGFAQRTYQVTSMGRPFNSTYWIRYNQIGGAILAIVAAVGLIFTLRSRL